MLGEPERVQTDALLACLRLAKEIDDHLVVSGNGDAIFGIVLGDGCEQVSSSVAAEPDIQWPARLATTSVFSERDETEMWPHAVHDVVAPTIEFDSPSLLMASADSVYQFSCDACATLILGDA